MIYKQLLDVRPCLCARCSKLGRGFGLMGRPLVWQEVGVVCLRATCCCWWWSDGSRLFLRSLSLRLSVEGVGRLVGGNQSRFQQVIRFVTGLNTTHHHHELTSSIQECSHHRDDRHIDTAFSTVPSIIMVGMPWHGEGNTEQAGTTDATEKGNLATVASSNPL